MSALNVLDEILARFEHGETLSPMPSGRRVSEARAEMRNRKVCGGKATSPTLIAWADRIDVAVARIGGAP